MNLNEFDDHSEANFYWKVWSKTMRPFQCEARSEYADEFPTLGPVQ